MEAVKRLLPVVFIALLLPGCASRYASLYRNLELERYDSCITELDIQGIHDAETAAIYAECSYHLEDYPTFLRYALQSMHESDEFRPRLVHFMERAHRELSRESIGAVENGELYQASGYLQHLFAIASAMDSLNLDPSFDNQMPDILKFSGEVHLQLGNTDRSRFYFERYRKIMGDGIQVLEKLAYIAWLTHDFPRCLALCDNILAMDPGHQTALLWRTDAVEMLGDRYVLNATLDALQHCRSTEKPMLHRNAGMIFFRMEKYPQALEHLLPALDSFVEEEDLLNTLVGQCYFFMGEYRDALNHFTLALSDDPENRDLLEYVTACEWFLGERQQARGLLKGKPLEMFPGSTLHQTGENPENAIPAGTNTDDSLATPQSTDNPPDLNAGGQP